MKWEHRPPHTIKLLVIAALIVAITITGALAAPEIPDEETKRAALLLGFELNEKSMTG